MNVLPTIFLSATMTALSPAMGCSEVAPTATDNPTASPTDTPNQTGVAAQQPVISEPPSQSRPVQDQSEEKPEIIGNNLGTPLGRADYTLSVVLQEIVTEDGLVHYERLRDKGLFHKLGMAVRDYGIAPQPEDPAERLALLCNAYNANVLRFAFVEQAKPDFTGVNNVSGFFDKYSVSAVGEYMTLNLLENEQIRPFGDPRIHAALVCAAMSCPTLRNERFEGSKISRQLDEQCRKWINDPSRNRVENGKLHLSEIFNWYGDDFKVAPYNGVVGFILAFAKPGGELANFLKDNPNPEIVWLPYNWALNQAPVSP